MKKQLLTAVSAFALMVSAPAIAEMNQTTEKANNPNTPQTQQYTAEETKEGLEKTWNKTKQTVSDAAKTVSKETKEAYTSVKDELTGENDLKLSNTIAIDPKMTAMGMIGEPVYDVNGERIAKVRDIIVNENGKAMMVILGDGDFTGLGKTVAFDYNTITKRSADGDMLTSLDERTIDMAAEFSYETSSNDNVRVMPSNGFSVTKLLDAKVITTNGDALADVDDISFRNGQADQLIVGYDKMLGLFGKQAAFSYSEADITLQNNENLAFKLSAEEATKFETFTKENSNS